MDRRRARSIDREASRITRNKARSFYLASLFLPRSVRRDTHIMYAFYRTVDDLVDEVSPGVDRAEVRALLREWKACFHLDSVPSNPFVAAARDLAERAHIPSELLCMVLDGAMMDLDLRTVKTRDELQRYAVLVAGSVGMVMCHLLGRHDEESLLAACDLGVAMQYTNVMRDVGEDLQRGRVYLPVADLERCGYSVAELDQYHLNEAFCSVMRSLASDARRYYASGMSGIARLDHSVQFSIYLAATLYSRILDDIEKHAFNVFTRRASLGATEKWMMTMPVYFRHRQATRRQT